MKEQLKIYLDRLQGGNEELLKETISSHLLDITDDDLKFSKEISIQGKAYLADDHLVLQLNLLAKATLLCTICNKPITLPIEIKNHYHALALEDIKASVYHYGDCVREVILLNTPEFLECQGGNCPERKNIKRFLVKEKNSTSDNDTTVQYPFSDLTIKDPNK